MKQEDESRVWMVAGALGSMALGIALIPLRTFTSASNFAFVFLIFTIIVAELGGRAAGLVTALVAAISLNFFLTEPYLRLTISKPDDVVAFFALAGCGLIAAAFGRRRERWSELAGREGKELDVLKKLVEQLRERRSLDDVLGDLKQSFGLSVIVLRDVEDKVLAAAPRGATPAVPETPLALDTLMPSNETRIRFGTRGLRLPEHGGRLRPRAEGGSISLDLWEGDEQGFGLDEGRTLTIVASILEMELSRSRLAGRAS
jgi:K+-sensing histidine kinase KdpD